MILFQLNVNHASLNEEIFLVGLFIQCNVDVS